MASTRITLRIISVLFVVLGTALPTLAQPLPMVTKHLYEFATPGGGGFPNDQINDHQAFVNAAAFFQARNGYGTLILEDGEYIIGKQVLHWNNEPLPGPDWYGYYYPFGGSNCPSLVANQIGFVLNKCTRFTIQGGIDTKVRYRDCLYYGTFTRTPGTNDVYSAVAVPGCLSCQDSAHYELPYELLHAEVGAMFTFYSCDSITVRDLDLNGNIDAAILGGNSSDDGIQTGYDALVLYQSANCLIDHVDAHHFGKDGLLI